MSLKLSPEEIDKLARKRAGAKMGWYIHATVYVLVNLMLFAISEFGPGQKRWSIYPLLGWGLGLALHGVSVFLLGTGAGFRERLVERERQRLLREQDREP
jgi:hypothetical protein